MKLNLILAKVFKFVTFVLFTFMTLVYFGVLLILPLDVMAQLIRLLVGIGLPTIVSALAGISVLAYLGLIVYRTPALYQLVLNIGIDLANFGHAQVKRFDPIIDAASGGESGSVA
ncbi:MAG: uncharacterized protein H6R26_210 [Proteobacteria bacterium]|nr:uncharacterized protein [Pseudomonadota bacterium]